MNAKKTALAGGYRNARLQMGCISNNTYELEVLQK